MNTDLTSNCMMHRQTPKGDAVNYLAFIVRIVHVFVEKQSAEKRRDVIGGKEEEPAPTVVS